MAIPRTTKKWSKGVVEWTEEDIIHLSVPFTWLLPRARERCLELRQQGYRVRAGGPAVILLPDYLRDVAELGGEVDALPRHNPDATMTSRGCIRHCRFCAVPRIEGELRELPTWEPRPIVCDNNLLACSTAHFDKVVDSLKPLSGIDFNQGLDARLLSRHHADRLGELDCIVRLAWDHISTGNAFMTAYETLRKAKIPKYRLQVLVLIGYDDTPEDAWFRLRTIFNLGLVPNPMRYNALDSLKRNSYVGPRWTDDLLRIYMQYWANTMYTGSVPFADYRDRKLEKISARSGKQKGEDSTDVDA